MGTIVSSNRIEETCPRRSYCWPWRDEDNDLIQREVELWERKATSYLLGSPRNEDATTLKLSSGDSEQSSELADQSSEEEEKLAKLWVEGRKTIRLLNCVAAA